jgi:prepilin signal peptidase PulO-like enzyme (type II secretory pathway)
MLPSPDFVFPAAKFWTIALFVFAFGCCVGSYLNVVIYRVPRNMKTSEPRRSFCPACKYQIPFYHNIPIVSWLLLRGKCANCKVAISPRYLFVEMLTGLLFFTAYVYLGTDVRYTGWDWAVIAAWIFLALAVAASFIDIDFQILPPSITWGGAVAGLVCAGLIPNLIVEGVWWMNMLHSLGGAAVGFGIIWCIVQLGKVLFGRLKFPRENVVLKLLCMLGGATAGFVMTSTLVVRQYPGDWQAALAWSLGGAMAGFACGWSVLRLLDRGKAGAETAPMPWRVNQDGEDVLFCITDKPGKPEYQESWADIFVRPKDRLIIQADTAILDEEREGGEVVPVTYNNVILRIAEAEVEIVPTGQDAGNKRPLEGIKAMKGTCKSAVQSREAMGMGDADWMACVGAFFGMKPAVVAIFAGCCVGAVLAFIFIVLRRREVIQRIPFGPYLAAGAVIWMFYGPQLLKWYFSLAHRESPPDLP